MKNYVKLFQEKLVYNRILNPKFWQNQEFDKKVRSKLLQIANDFYKDLKVDAPILDVHLTGSMASFTWTEHSDLDIHVIIDFSEIDENTELVRDALLGKKFTWNLRHPVQINGYDVELYVQDDDTETISAGIYSLMKDEWVKKPTYNPPKVDTYLIANKVESYKKEVDALNDILLDDIEDDAQLIFDRLKVLKKKISGTRDEGLQRDGEFSIENLVFKEFRSQGYIEKLIKLQAFAYSKIYSDKGFKPDKSKIFEKDINEQLTDKEKYAAKSEYQELVDLEEIGLLDKSHIDSYRNKLVNDVGGIDNLVKDQILGEVILGSLNTAMDSDIYRALCMDGWYSISKDFDLFNGLILLSTDSTITSKIGYTFIKISKNGYIKRHTREGNYTSNYGDEIEVLKIIKSSDQLTRYIKAFEWIYENIDPNSTYLSLKQ